jgi:PAS domain S-box-containing protein
MSMILWKILLVDDDEDDFLLVKEMLSEAHQGKCELIWQDTYESGKESLLTNSFDAALIDYDLGLHTGLELIREAINAGIRTAIILFTGRGSFEVDLEAMQAGATLYLTKGETSALMLERGIRYAIERKQYEEALAEANALLIKQKAELVEKNRLLQETNSLLEVTLLAQQESEERLDYAAEAAHFGTYSFNLLSGKGIWSPEFKILLGLNEDDDLALDANGIYIGVHREDRNELLRKMIESRKPGGNGILDLEYRVVIPEDGSVRWLHVHGRTLFEGQGKNRKPTRAVGAVVDITHRMLMEASLRKSEERLRSVFDSMAEGFALHEIILDKTGSPCDYRFLEVNPAFEKLTGLQAKEIVGRSMKEVLPDDDPNWIQIYGKVALTGSPIHFEKYSPALKMHYSVFAFRPTPFQFAVMFTNISDRIKMEEQLKVNLTKYSVLFDSFPLGITVTDKDGNILETNREAERLLGVPRSDHLERQIDGAEWKLIRLDGSIMPPNEYPSVRALKENKRIENVEAGVVMTTEDGGRKVTWINITAMPIPLAGYGVIVTYSDITDRKVAEGYVRE